MTSEEYWKRIERVPLKFENDIPNSDSRRYRAQNGVPVSVTKPEYFKTDEEREAAVRFYEQMYSRRYN